MVATSVSLLDRLRTSPPDHDDWGRLQDIYEPLIRGWLSRIPGLGDEVADLTQEVMVVLSREIPHFERRREGSFRAWLRQVTVNRVRIHRRQQRRRPVTEVDPAEGFLDQLAAPQSALTREWDVEHDQYVFRKLQVIVGPEFSPDSWEAFRRFAIDGLPAARVAAELGLSINSVLLAKSRILKRMREEAGDLLA